jgi:hypothetical protein
MLHSGLPKRNQGAHVLVTDLDVGPQDLQQCADAVIRLRAEYLWGAGRADDVCFRFTRGDLATWARWRDGWRPRMHDNAVRWERSAPPALDRANFRSYLDTVFTFAGTSSLSRELTTPTARDHILPGDVLIEPGFPGHAVVVLDVAEDRQGRRIYLLGQSYMPAQQLHVLKAPGSSLSPWYEADPRGPVATPEWRFPEHSWRRFPEPTCRVPARRALAPARRN